ncbi:glycosyltransferase family 2 protein [Methylobacterium aerolatum]|uniref:glycosyltransferase family 2 protein n=1 Tax=Methylobacterium aerolatum TaxID=418708 RepID=UPI0024B5894B|nr:glycosyltransferase family 2 protein [Methylobacterium aerolatum]
MDRKISCTIIAKNEEDRIAECLRSVRDVADEIVVVDSGSSDRTLEICRSFGATCHHHDWQGFGQQKRFAEDRATHDWILNIDADEWLTPDLQREIKAWAAAQPEDGIVGYRIDIKTVYPGQDRPRPLADQHRYVRLYDRRFCRFPASAAFDEIHLPSRQVRALKHPMYHRSIRSLSHYIEKNIAYFNIQCSEKIKGRYLFFIRVLVEPFGAFFKYYILRRHFTGGCYGFLIASTAAVLRTYRLMLLTFPHRPR